MTELGTDQFYTGLVADLYAPLRGITPDPAMYAQFIREVGGPALELGCGHGDPLLALRSEGLDVEGLDSSADMLDQARVAAADQGLEVVLHEQDMATFQTDRTYRAIFLAGPTFNLLANDDAAVSCLRSIRAHLDDNGSALIPLYLPPPVDDDKIGPPFAEQTTADGAQISCAMVSVERDEKARTQTTVLRYERITEQGSEALERPWVLHWHLIDGITALAETAGMTVTAVTDFAGEPITVEPMLFLVRMAPSSS